MQLYILLLIALTQHAKAVPTYQNVKVNEESSIPEDYQTLESDLDQHVEHFSNEIGVAKRSPFTVDFMGMQVSYPQYLRLVALQEKVVKLDKLIKALQARYTPEELEQLPQYARLQTLHQSLLPLLPNNGQLPENEEDEVMVDKRSPFSVDFMGMQVSYPQYLRLVALQEKVVQLDKLLKKMRQFKTEEELAKIPQWQRLVSLHGSLKKLLPADYLAEDRETEDIQVEPVFPQKRGVFKRTVEFNGVKVSLPQYLRLMELQEKVLRLDQVLRRLSDGVDPEKLAASAKWGQLVSMRQSLQRLLPEDHPDFNKRGGATMDFNGVQVSYPQYVHLMNLQRKVMALDAAMNKIAAKTDEESLERLPTWQKLMDLRGSLAKLMPQGEMVMN